MQSRELLITALNQSYGLVLPLLEDLKTAPHVTPTSEGGNHAHWILGHLLHSEGGFQEMMRGVENPVNEIGVLFGGGSSPEAGGNGYPPYDELLGRLIELRGETMDWLNSLAEEDLDQASQNVLPGFEPFFGTWRLCLLMQAMHWMNHRGQLADCRRAAGRSCMMA